MGKLLFWLIVIFAGLLTARLLAQQAAKKSRQQSAPHAPLTSNGHTSEALVRCTHCGIHLPRSQAVLMDEQIWCSQEHARQHAHEHANTGAR